MLRRLFKYLGIEAVIIITAAFLLLLIAAWPVAAAQRVSVNDLGADAAGRTISTEAFREAIRRAGHRGIVECDPGVYRIADVRLSWSSFIFDCPADLVAVPGATSILSVGYGDTGVKPRHIVLRFNRMLGGAAPGVRCLDLRDMELGKIEFLMLQSCGTGIYIEPERSNVSDIQINGSSIGYSDTGIYIEPGAGWAQGIRVTISFIARNTLGIHMPHPTNRSGLNEFRVALDLNERDAIIESPNGLLITGFVTPDAPPVGEGLDSWVFCVLGPPQMRECRFPKVRKIGGRHDLDLSGLLR